MSQLYDLARQIITTSSNSASLTLGAAAPGFLTMAQAGIPDGAFFDYGIEDGTTGRETGTGLYSANTFIRVPKVSTNSNTFITLSGTAQLFVTTTSSNMNSLVLLKDKILRGLRASRFNLAFNQG